MTDQPEALRLADRLAGRWALHPEMLEAAAELRRQHDEIEKLQAERDALLAALLEYAHHKAWCINGGCDCGLIAAIDAARGKP